MGRKKCLVIINLRGKSNLSYVSVLKAYEEEKKIIIKLKEDESLENKLNKIYEKYSITSILIDEQLDRLSPQFKEDLTKYIEYNLPNDVDVMCLEQRARLVDTFSENIYSVLV